MFIDILVGSLNFSSCLNGNHYDNSLYNESCKSYKANIPCCAEYHFIYNEFVEHDESNKLSTSKIMQSIFLLNDMKKI